MPFPQKNKFTLPSTVFFVHTNIEIQRKLLATSFLLYPLRDIVTISFILFLYITNNGINLKFISYIPHFYVIVNHISIKYTYMIQIFLLIHFVYKNIVSFQTDPKACQKLEIKIKTRNTHM